jgi:hypothetical protein
MSIRHGLLVTGVVAGSLVGAFAALIIPKTPALAAPRWVEDNCRYQADRALPANAREREAYIANCIADWTAGSEPPQTTDRY